MCSGTVRHSMHGEGLSCDRTVMPLSDIYAMMLDRRNRAGSPLKKAPADAGTMYQLSVRAMSCPKHAVFASRAMDKLTKWWTHFQLDVFAAIPDDFPFPMLPDRGTFYTTRFYGPTGEHYEVAVCPVFHTARDVTGDDMIRVTIFPPELPETYTECLHGPFFAEDIMHIEALTTRYSAYVGTGDYGQPDMPPWRRGLTRVSTPRPVLPGLTVPPYWDFTFQSMLGEERICGAKSIPLVLGRMWMLRDCVSGPVSRQMVHLTEVAYVGCIRNLAGFNVFFQVNANLPVETMLEMCKGGPARCPPNARGRPLKVPATVHLPMTKATLLSEYGRMNKVIEAVKMHLKDANNKASVPPTEQEQRQIDLWKRVAMFARSVQDRYKVISVKVHLQDKVEAVDVVRQVLAKIVMADTPLAASGIPEVRQRQLAQAVFVVKYAILQRVLETMSHRQLVKLSQALAAPAKVDDTLAFVSLVDIAKYALGKTSADLLHDPITAFVPTLCEHQFELALFCCAYPERLSDKHVDTFFGSRDILYQARTAWGKKNELTLEDPASEEPGLINMVQRLGGPSAKPFTQREFATWFVHELAQKDAKTVSAAELLTPSTPRWVDAYK